jgi:ABC-2 type transport system ATP-binding protein
VSEASGPAILCRGLVHVYPGDVRAVDGLDLEVARGECFGLLGPNGAGKTTTVEALEGLIQPTSGHIELVGLSWQRHEKRLRAKVGVTFQQTDFSPRLSVLETLSLFRSFYAAGAEPGRLVTELGLDEKRAARVGDLSGGQRQRLALACALVGEPEILFLDEPTTGLDPQARRALWEIVRRLRAEGKTILLTTHYMDEAQRLCDRVAIVDHGRILAEGTPAELIRSLGAEHLVELEAQPDGWHEKAELQTLPGVRAVERQGSAFLLTVREPHETIPALLQRIEQNGARLARLATHQATLEDVFVHLTGRSLVDA